MPHQISEPFEEASRKLIAFLEQRQYSEAWVNHYKTNISHINEFMKHKEYSYYTPEVCKEFISSIIDKKTYQDLTRKDKTIVRSANALLEYQLTGTINFRSIRKEYTFEGAIGDSILQFIMNLNSQNRTKSTITSYRLYLSRFYNYLIHNGVESPKDLDAKVILAFINTQGFYNPPTIHRTLACVKGFLKYLYNQHEVDIDWAFLIPKSTYKSEAKLPSTYTSDEIDRLIKAIDRGNPKGKRDFAMILLAAKLGLRAADICNLLFENILWDENTITLNQQKNQKQIELPLLSDVGNAIIDYLKYGRVKSDLPFIFLHASSPYQKLNSSTLHTIVTQYLTKAGISFINERKHGPHALRHSLAGQLLKKRTPLPVISEVLGHSKTSSTEYYLRIDLSTLKQCLIEVPIMITSFHAKEVL